MTGELTTIQHLRARLLDESGRSWIGDDAAVVPAGDGWMLLCADAVVAGVHVDLSLAGVDDLGWKAMAANVSDIAAMGGSPRHALVTVAAPLAALDAELLYDGLVAAAETYGCAIVGGDLTSAPSLVVTVALVGWSPAAGPPPVRRSGAAPGDALFLTGPLGSSAAGRALLSAGRAGEAPDLARAHRRPEARLAEGTAAREAGATAMIDVSDGLAADLRHLADESGVGVVIDRVPVAIGVSRAGDDPEAMALGGGEDYELVFTAPDRSRVEDTFAEAGLGVPLVIGRCTADPAERRLRDRDLPRLGWEHQ